MPLTARSSRSKTARLDQCGHTLLVEPVIDELILMFRTVSHRSDSTAIGAVVRRAPSLLVTVDGETMLFPAGLKQLVREALERLGYGIDDRGRDVDSRLRELDDPMPLSSRALERLDILDFFRGERGIILCNPQHSQLPARVIRLVANAWPDRRVVCAVTRRSDAYRLARDLRRSISRERIYCVNQRPGLDRPNQIAIGTYGHLGGFEANLHNRDFFFALQPAELLANYDGRLCIRNADQARLFGFLPIGQKLPLYYRDLINAYFGPDKLVVTRVGQIERPVSAILLPFSGGVPVGRHQGNSSLLHAGIWQHKKRNQTIGKVARALAGGDFAALSAIVKNEVTRQLLAGDGSRRRVGVYTANIEQAVAIYPYLRGWKLVTGTPVQLDGLSAEEREAVRFGRRQPNRSETGLIVTPNGLPRVRKCDIFVRADSGVGSLPTTWARKNTGNGVFPPPRVIIVDLWDRHHPALRKRSRSRLEAYLEAGFRLPAEFDADLDQFLATRPPLESFR